MSSCRPDERISFTLSELSRERQTPRRRTQVDEEFAVRSAAAVAGYDSEAAIRDEEAALRVDAHRPPKLKSRSCFSSISACFVAIWAIGCVFTFLTLILLQLSSASGGSGGLGGMSGSSGMSGMSGMSGSSGMSASSASHLFWPWDDSGGASSNGPSQHRLVRDTTIKDRLEFGLWDSRQRVTKLQLQVAVSLALGVRADDDDVSVELKENHFFDVEVQHATAEEEDFVSSIEFLQRLNMHVGVYDGQMVVSKPAKLVKFVAV